MRILFLGGQASRQLSDWLELQREVVFFTDKHVNLPSVKEIDPEIIISYNYRHILSQEIIDAVDGKAVNLHISYLPYNKGAHPNLWSILDNTPTGVTIHYIDAGIDTGDILVQKKVAVGSHGETLKSSYEKLQNEIQSLFKTNWEKIRNGTLKRQAQIGSGTYHCKADFQRIADILDRKGWDITIEELKRRYRESNHST